MSVATRNSFVQMPIQYILKNALLEFSTYFNMSLAWWAFVGTMLNI